MSNSSESFPLLGGVRPDPGMNGLPNPSPLFSDKADWAFRSAHRDRVQMEMAPRTFFSKAMEGNGVAIDGLSLGRNSANGFAAIAGTAEKVAGAVGGLAIAGGAMGTLSGLNGMRNAGVRLAKDYQTGNWEGGAVNSLSMASSGGYATLSSSMVVTNAATFAGAAGTAAAAGSVITVAGIAMYGLLGIAAGYGIGANVSFRRDLNRIAGQDGEQLADAMGWLAAQVRGDTIQSKLEKKWDRFAFRSSEAACRLVRDHATPEFFRRLEMKDPEAIKTAQSILREVQRENSKQILKHSIMMAIAILGIAAFIAGLVFSGPFAPLLFAFGAILWILVDSSQVHVALGDKLFGKSEIPAPTLPKLSPPLPAEERTACPDLGLAQGPHLHKASKEAQQERRGFWDNLSAAIEEGRRALRTFAGRVGT